MYSNNVTFYPKQIYIDLDFKNIKSNLSNTYKEHQDFGSVFVAQNSTYLVSINNIGKLQVFYNFIEEKTVDEIISEVELEFKKQISDFEIQKKKKLY
ncbi:hypothetical protein [Clostridium neonatale]|uniref:hypothetical protein n=1 Tax=Clostridium neonatale TaxID=137838 RepID=UPI00291C3AA1|nr:hypothetical protein [Clostridium neonatale]CAI3206084.1 conserved hypothetical protein [Clostridium neonatale]CAI3210313.1 conserved hypothetical protein [Clostridium neonatale]CAI3606381.1 conserved hypothetical protein [Clostridium neonatale]